MKYVTRRREEREVSTQGDVFGRRLRVGKSRGWRSAMLMAAALAALGSTAPLFVATSATAAESGAAAMPEDLSGNWLRDFRRGNFGFAGSPSVKQFTLMDGTVIPLKPEAEKLYRKRLEEGETGQPFANTTSRCLPLGTPYNMMGAPYPIQIVQKPNFIAILVEEGGNFRSIYMNGKHPTDLIPSFMGHSVGHWEGKTLVIETVGLRDDTTLNGEGLPHSTEMKVVERLTRTAPDTLVDRIEINDPVDYYKPFTFESIFKHTDEEQIEYICENSNISVTADGRQIYGQHK